MIGGDHYAKHINWGFRAYNSWCIILDIFRNLKGYKIFVPPKPTYWYTSVCKTRYIRHFCFQYTMQHIPQSVKYPCTNFGSLNRTSDPQCLFMNPIISTESISAEYTMYINFKSSWTKYRYAGSPQNHWENIRWNK